MSEKCFCHLNGYAVKDATARQNIEVLNSKVNNNLMCNIIHFNQSINNSLTTLDVNVEKGTYVGLSDFMLEDISEKRNIHVNIADFKKAGFDLKKVEISLKLILQGGIYNYNFESIVCSPDREVVSYHNKNQYNMPNCIGCLVIENYDDVDITLNLYTQTGYSNVFVDDIVLYYDRTGNKTGDDNG